MAETINTSYGRNKHRGESGNAICDPIKVMVPNSAVAGDTEVIDTGPWDTLYTSIKIGCEAITAGLTVRVGAREINGDFADDDFFGEQTLAANSNFELLNIPKEFVNASGRKVDHEVYVTFNGTVTPDDVFWVTAEKLCFGAPL